MSVRNLPARCTTVKAQSAQKIIGVFGFNLRAVHLIEPVKSRVVKNRMAAPAPNIGMASISSTDKGRTL